MTIAFQEILAGSMAPAIEVEVDWESGVSALPSLARRLLLVGASGKLPGEVHRVTSLAQAIDLWGEGCPLCGMVQAALAESPKIPIYGMAVAAGTGTATLNATITGTASAAGYIRVWVAGRLFTVPVSNGDAAADVATAIIDAIDAEQYNLPVDPSNGGAGIVTFDAVTDGAAGNSIRIRVDCRKAPGLSVNLGGGAVRVDEEPLASGTTDTDPSTALAAIRGDERFHLVALGCEDTTAISSLTTHMEWMSQPSVGKPGIGIAATVGGSSGAQSIADTENSKRTQVVDFEDSPRPVWEIAASFAARRAATDPRNRIIDAELKWLMPPSESTTWYTVTEIEADLDEGVTPLYCQRQGASVHIARSIHTEHGSSMASQKAWNASIVEKADYYAEALKLAFGPYKGNAFKSTSPAGRPTTITPNKAKAIAVRQALELDGLDWLDGVQVDADAGRFSAEVNATDPNRLDLAVPFRPSRELVRLALQLVYTY